MALKAAGRLFQVRGGLDLKAREPGGLRGVGGEKVGQGEELFCQGGDAVFREQREAAAGGQHRVQHQGGVQALATCRPRCGPAPAVASIPTFTAATGKSLSTASSCAATTSGATGWTAWTPWLFWTVRAVTTVRP